jgi:hypothetical protein
MNGWERMKVASNRFDKGVEDSVKAGGIFDLRTYKGSILFLLASAAATYFLWHLHDLLIWLIDLEGTVDDTPTKQSWSQLWAWIIGIPPMALAILAMIMIPINQHRDRKRARSPWDDKPKPSAADFQDKEHNSDEDEPAQPRD